MECLTLEQWRRLRGLSQGELAKKVGISERSIWNYEKDVEKLRNASYDTVSLIADALRVKTSQIFLDTTSEKPNNKNDDLME